LARSTPLEEQAAPVGRPGCEGNKSPPAGHGWTVRQRWTTARDITLLQLAGFSLDDRFVLAAVSRAYGSVLTSATLTCFG